ncbi:MAG: hypothetical protein Q9217_001576 [Psora testacea]
MPELKPMDIGTDIDALIKGMNDHVVIKNMIIAKKLGQLKYPEVSQQLRFSFFFANMIIYELAYSIEGAYIPPWHEHDRIAWTIGGHFNIPRIGATSLYVNSFTTMSWSEDKRVAREDVKDLMASVAERPPPKVWMISTGAKQGHRPDSQEAIENAVAEEKHEKHG